MDSAGVRAWVRELSGTSLLLSYRTQRLADSPVRAQGNQPPLARTSALLPRDTQRLVRSSQVRDSTDSSRPDGCGLAAHRFCAHRDESHLAVGVLYISFRHGNPELLLSPLLSVPGV